ncbi:MAG: YggT family protein [Candidatus Curtissbacteria bacterium]|nr:YggT family protein [Candidatus Curtissbacteria bacterium]
MQTQQATDTQTVKTVSTNVPAVDTGSPQKAYGTKKAIFRLYQVIWYILGVVEVLLASRILLKLIGANLNSGFTSFIYSVSAPLASPFRGVLGVTRSSESVIEWSTIIAMAVYAVVAVGLVKLFQIVKPTTEQEVNQSVNNQ